MMGRLNHDQGQLFYSFCLEEVVPDDHLVRSIAAVLDLSWVHAELAPHYADIGRPSIDPALMIRMIEKVEAARLAAMQAGQFSAAVAAVKEIGILSGIRIERAERGIPGEFDNMSVDELRAYIRSQLALIGESGAGVGA